ncbi:M48 family metallopeptidase [uncultured Sphingobium sp.]|uniref:M48 family metallopeptidase n=1 Tax=uncultured Sphingobium sp. TaxID=316087 RepID=UPI0025901AF3|nr:M48 family metallopeptidase [uncultured Sphingobium sp.]
MTATMIHNRVTDIKRRKSAGLRLALISAAAIALLGISTAADELPLFEVIRAVDTEMAGIGQRLALSNVSLCDRQEPGLGLVLHTPDQYSRDVRDAAIRHFRFEGPVGVEAIIPGSAAAAAGVRVDDTLLGVEQKRFDPADPEAEASTAALTSVTRWIMALPTNRPMVLHMRRDGTDQERILAPIAICRSRFEVVPGPEFVARADGEIVQIGSRFFADYPEWVAAPIAHELAHNILRHRERLEGKGVNYGLLSGIGRNVGYFRQTEIEADILSVSLLANAGFDPKIAVLFWRAFGPAHSASIFRSRSHPAWKERVAIIERAIDELGPARPHRPTILAARNQVLDGNWRVLLEESH